MALMWFAVDAAAPLGVVAVRLVEALPALLFGSATVRATEVHEAT